MTYAMLSRHAGEEPQAIRLLEDLSRKPGQSVLGQEAIHFALARLYESGGDYDSAFSHGRTANALRSEKSDLQSHLAEMDAIESVFTRDFLEHAPRSGHSTEKPVFIVGMPRSGTSLIEQILSSHPDVYGGGELTFLWEITKSLPTGAYPASVPALAGSDLDGCARRYLEKIDALAAGEMRVTDKLPHNFLHLGLIELLFPGARVIYCSRDARDVCLSIFLNRFNLNHIYARDLGELGVYYRRHQALMTHWSAVLGIPMLEVNYEELVGDFDAGVRRMLDFCGLEWNAACMEFHRSSRIVATPSYDQVSRPIYSSSIGRWKRYERYLEPLLEALGD